MNTISLIPLHKWNKMCLIAKQVHGVVHVWRSRVSIYLFKYRAAHFSNPNRLPCVHKFNWFLRAFYCLSPRRTSPNINPISYTCTFIYGSLVFISTAILFDPTSPAVKRWGWLISHACTSEMGRFYGWIMIAYYYAAYAHLVEIEHLWKVSAAENSTTFQILFKLDSVPIWPIMQCSVTLAVLLPLNQRDNPYIWHLLIVWVVLKFDGTFAIMMILIDSRRAST